MKIMFWEFFICVLPCKLPFDCCLVPVSVFGPLLYLAGYLFLASILPPVHYLSIILISISTIFSQLACLGVWINLILFINALAFWLSTVSMREPSKWMFKLSRTSWMQSALGNLLINHFTKRAKSDFVRVLFALTKRSPALGCTARNILQVALRLY